jgi:ABC-type transport system involved in cytochrome c biogenesis permease subunit
MLLPSAHPATPELATIWLGCALLWAATGAAWRTQPAVAAAATPLVLPRSVQWLVDAALIAIAAGLAQRWWRLGHGPFLSMFEILASSLLSLGLIWRVAAARMATLRPTAATVLPVLSLMAAWLVATNPADTHFPATYDTPVLWFHVLLGKLFLGCAFVAVGLAGVVLARTRARGACMFARLPDDAWLDALAWRFMAVALVFESLMLIAGAVWAQDAWGRYWAWDPLETWAFVTWLALAAALHARLAWRLTPRAGAAMIAAVFAIAFLTFFGVPFVSVAPHKGAV